MINDTYIVLVWSFEAGATVDQFNALEEATEALKNVVTQSDFSLDDESFDILSPSVGGFKSVLTPGRRASLKEAHYKAIRDREEAI
jgi:gamma-glutamyltranspeptidase